LIPFHGCDAGAGATQGWTAYGEPDPLLGLQNCGGSNAELGTQGDTLLLAPCSLGNGASGGPWVSVSANSVGVVNSGCCNATPLSPFTLAGAYLGTAARAALGEAEEIRPEAAIAVLSQNVPVDSTGAAALRVACATSTPCRGTAQLSVSCPTVCLGAAAARTARASARRRAVVVGRTRFAIRGHRRATVRVGLHALARWLLTRHRGLLAATATLRTTRSHVSFPAVLHGPRRLATALRAPAGCTVRANPPEVRHGHVSGIGLLRCAHRQRFGSAYTLLQRRVGVRWKLVSAGVSGGGVLRANIKYRLASKRVGCRQGFYRSVDGVGFPHWRSRVVARRSKGKTLTCA
jgi:hypothetical protein